MYACLVGTCTCSNMDRHLSRLGTNACTCVWRPKEPRFLSTFFTEGGFLPDNRALDSQLVLRIPTVSEALGLQGPPYLPSWNPSPLHSCSNCLIHLAIPRAPSLTPSASLLNCVILLPFKCSQSPADMYSRVRNHEESPARAEVNYH